MNTLSNLIVEMYNEVMYQIENNLFEERLNSKESFRKAIALWKNLPQAKKEAEAKRILKASKREGYIVKQKDILKYADSIADYGKIKAKKSVRKDLRSKKKAKREEKFEKIKSTVEDKDLENKTRIELLALATKKGMKITPKMNREELLSLFPETTEKKIKEIEYTKYKTAKEFIKNELTNPLDSLEIDLLTKNKLKNIFSNEHINDIKREIEHGSPYKLFSYSKFGSYKRDNLIDKIKPVLDDIVSYYISKSKAEIYYEDMLTKNKQKERHEKSNKEADLDIIEKALKNQSNEKLYDKARQIKYEFFIENPSLETNITLRTFYFAIKNKLLTRDNKIEFMEDFSIIRDKINKKIGEEFMESFRRGEITKEEITTEFNKRIELEIFDRWSKNKQ